MAGFRLLPTTLLATIVAFVLTSEVGLIHTQRERDVVGEKPAEDARGLDRSELRNGAARR